MHQFAVKIYIFFELFGCKCLHDHHGHKMEDHHDDKGNKSPLQCHPSIQGVGWSGWLINISIVIPSVKLFPEKGLCQIEQMDFIIFTYQMVLPPNPKIILLSQPMIEDIGNTK